MWYSRLEEHFKNLGQNLEQHKTESIDRAVRNFFKVAGIEASPRKADANKALSQASMAAIESAVAAIILTLIRGASGLSPNYLELEQETEDILLKGGWHRAGAENQTISAEVRVTLKLITQEIPEDKWYKFYVEDAALLRANHAKLVAGIVGNGAAIPGVKQAEAFFRHQSSGDSLVHFQWRDHHNRHHTHIGIHVFLGSEFERVGREAILMDTIWRTLQLNYHSREADHGIIVSGRVPLRGRDGTDTSFMAIQVANQLVERCKVVGIPIRKIQFSVQIHEQML